MSLGGQRGGVMSYGAVKEEGNVLNQALMQNNTHSGVERCCNV